MHVIAINRSAGLAVTDIGVACAVSVWIDGDGDETDDRAAAVVAVVSLPNGKWESVDLREFDQVEAH